MHSNIIGVKEWAAIYPNLISETRKYFLRDVCRRDLPISHEMNRMDSDKLFGRTNFSTLVVPQQQFTAPTVIYGKSLELFDRDLTANEQSAVSATPTPLVLWGAWQ